VTAEGLKNSKSLRMRISSLKVVVVATTASDELGAVGTNSTLTQSESCGCTLGESGSTRTGLIILYGTEVMRVN
jgi:hypothetical protein